MSVGPLGGAGYIAGAPLAQTKGSELERTQQESVRHERQVAGEQQASDAAGIGRTDGENHDAQERDADGRRLWEAPLGKRRDGDSAATEPPQASKDPAGVSGNQLDLSG